MQISDGTSVPLEESYWNPNDDRTGIHKNTVGGIDLVLKKDKRVEALLEIRAIWAMDFKSAAHKDSHVVARIAGQDITVGHLRRAFEAYFHVPFIDYQQGRLPEMVNVSVSQEKVKKVETVRKNLAQALSVTKLYPRSHSSTGAMRRYRKGESEDKT